MKILFVSSGNLRLKRNPIILNQAASLKEHQNIEVEHYFIKGKGIWGYLRNIPPLKKYIKEIQPDIVHAHYSFSGIVTSLATNKPVITSLMGSDINKSGVFRILIKFFYKHLWYRTIVKSQVMKNKLGVKKAFIIPNGVAFDKFFPISKSEAKKRVFFDQDTKYVLFIGDPSRIEKNVELAKAAFEIVSKHFSCKLKVVYDTNPDLIPYYLNASEVLLMTSRWEGSPNVIKEAMACNLPIVSTDVGDVKKNIENCKGCYIVKPDPLTISDHLKKVLMADTRTDGRKHIGHLSSEKIANKLVAMYKDSLSN